MSFEVSYTDFNEENIVFGEISTFETNTESGIVKTSRLHIGYEEKNYIQLQLPVVSFTLYPPKDGLFKNNKTSTMLQFNNISTKKMNEILPMDEYFQYDKYLDVMDAMIEKIITYLLDDKQRLEAFKIEHTELINRKPVPIEPEIIVKNLKKVLSQSVYYIPMEERDYQFSTYADIAIPNDDENNKRPPTLFTNLKGENVPFESLVGKKVIGIPTLNFYLNRSSKLSICRLLRSMVILKLEKANSMSKIPKSTQNIMQSNPTLFMKLNELYEESEKNANEDSCSEHYDENSSENNETTSKIEDIMQGY